MSYQAGLNDKLPLLNFRLGKLQLHGWVGPLTTISFLRATFPSGGTGRSSGKLLEEPKCSYDELFVVEVAIEELLLVALLVLESAVAVSRLGPGALLDCLS